MTIGVPITLALNAAATGNSITWPGGPGVFSAEATWGGGNVVLQTLTPYGTWMAVGADGTLLANGMVGFILPANAQVRVAITTATAVCAYVTPLS